jgi:hypothetical protein
VTDLSVHFHLFHPINSGDWPVSGVNAFPKPYNPTHLSPRLSSVPTSHKSLFFSSPRLRYAPVASPNPNGMRSTDWGKPVDMELNVWKLMTEKATTPPPLFVVTYCSKFTTLLIPSESTSLLFTTSSWSWEPLTYR